MTAIYGVSHEKSSDLNASESSLAEIQSKEDVADNRLNSIEIVKSFNAVKTLIWSCTFVVDAEGSSVERDDQCVDMELLLDHLKEIKLLLELHEADSTYGITEKTILRRLTLVRSNDIGSILSDLND